ncbi:bifunctional [glutamate--ammonia ligase]-adenylyl-L-tyrosine phosphorylase/[glutamate--ammonia-ligase] adenylyltransferase [Massilia sp. W12]|uniref:bifunctional [glutamate--ammonia ligase]-adenylyl-L-tyrosine phosphorylase/[glutamate--ammonia-ligase] adenylyltransferase n=1 Tax=Massilia sp. W12 TaxID=3126507 RepID=UPI0030CCAA6C
MPASLLPPIQASRFCSRWLQADSQRPAQLAEVCRQPLHTLDFGALLAAQQGHNTAHAMRRLRNLLLCAIITRDLDGRADLSEVMQSISRFADFAIATLLAECSAEAKSLYGAPVGEESGGEQHLLVVGMGKLGAHELNVSSDIDLIFLYGENGETQAGAGQKSLSNHEYFIRLGKKLIGALSEIGEDGFCFRVDMMLRPHGKSGPLAASLAMLEEYLLLQGREWERYAWVKARAICGAAADIAALQDIVRPFVYRRYLDYGVIDSLRTLHSQIRAEVVRQERTRPEHSNNIKLGRGGIREIEFLTQVFQLIRGGREAELRHPATRHTLDVLDAMGLLEAGVVARLQQCYAFLRNLEHRLQYVDDAQTHMLPQDAAELSRIAQMMGFADSAALLQQLQATRSEVAEQFDAMFAAPDEADGALPDSNAETAEWRAHMQEQGFADAAAAAHLLQALFASPKVSAISAAGRERLQTLVQQALPLIVQHAKPEQRNACLARLTDFFEAIARRAAYLSLLIEYPHTLQRVVQMLAASGWAAQFLNQHPILLDELLDDRLLLAPTDWPQLAQQIATELQQAAGDTERQLDILREVHHAQLFHLLAQDLNGAWQVEALADQLSYLADAIVAAIIPAAWATLAQRHRETPRFAVIAYGRLGGKELGYVSDLDVIFLYEDEEQEAQALYVKLAQRFITWMTTHTPAGILFDIDTALRPDGASGTLVSSVAAFARYQHESAWVWEHQALTRARFCAGDAAIGARFEQIRNQVLCKVRDEAKLKEEVCAMRQRMRQAQRNPDAALFELKSDPGGMIDCEFIVQYLVLRHAAQYPQLTENLGNIALLKRAANLGLIDIDAAQNAADAYRSLRRLQHKSRLQGEERARVPHEEVATESRAIRELWQLVLG